MEGTAKRTLTRKPYQPDDGPVQFCGCVHAHPPRYFRAGAVTPPHEAYKQSNFRLKNISGQFYFLGLRPLAGSRLARVGLSPADFVDFGL